MLLRDRATWLMGSGKDEFVDFVAKNLLELLEDCKKTFPTALCLWVSLGSIKHLLHGLSKIEYAYVRVRESTRSALEGGEVSALFSLEKAIQDNSKRY